MNQFKKAKQLRSETGHITESITDLTTAGVAKKQENTESSTANKNDTNTEEKKALPNTSDTNTAAEAKIDEQKAPVQPLASTTDSTPANMEPILNKAEDNIMQNPTVIQPETVLIPVPSQSEMKTNVVPSPAQEIITANTQELQTAVPQTNNVPFVTETISPDYNVPLEYHNIPVPVTAQSYNEPQQPQEITITQQNNVRKKSAPNIFAPKSEAKSMRKSLVLKPTSVKIAENYCEKNGGSFNELIQTLLDNFIDEYGL